MTTCGYHADIMISLAGPSPGPATQAVIDKLNQSRDEECITPESQIVLLFLDAMRMDAADKPVVGQ